MSEPSSEKSSKAWYRIEEVHPIDTNGRALLGSMGAKKYSSSMSYILGGVLHPKTFQYIVSLTEEELIIAKLSLPNNMSLSKMHEQNTNTLEELGIYGKLKSDK